jgi:hypothetical protein
MTDVEYIDVLIESEKSELSRGWKERIMLLEDQKKLAVMIAEAQDPNFNPFKQYNDGTKTWTSLIVEKLANLFNW